MAEKLRVATFNVENLFNRYAMLDTPFNGTEHEKFVLPTGVVFDVGVG